jgi:hypothetical protein
MQIRRARAAGMAAIVLAVPLSIQQKAYSQAAVTNELTCASAEWNQRSGSADYSPSLHVRFAGDSRMQTFMAASRFFIQFTVVSPSADVLAWQINDYTGATIRSGSFPVQGTGILDLPCTSKLAGYFSVSAQLQKARRGLPREGSRPQGIATFGVLPSVPAYIQAPAAALDDHRFGLQGANFVASGVCCEGNGLQPVNGDLGSTWVLDSRSEYNMEPNNAGQYNPATQPLDVGFQNGEVARIVTLNGLPAWASTAPSPTAIGSYPPKSFPAFEAYVARVGEESARVRAAYIPHQRNNYYQVTWEPDPGPATQWMGTDEQFVELYQAAWQGAHATDPSARVMGPTTMSIPLCSEWLTRLAPLGFTKYLDAVSCHGYYAISASSAIPPESAGLAEQMQGLRQTMTKLLPAGTKLFVTETGIAYPAGAQYSASYPTAEVLTQHAQAVVRTHLIMLGEGADTSFLFYSADYSAEVGYGLYFNLSMPDPDFGSPNISPKPAAMAVAAATRLVDGTRTLGAIATMPANTYGYSFLCADGAHTITALWAHDSSFEARVPYVMEVDAAKKNGWVAVFDAMGNAVEQRYSNGALQVELTEMPIYVLSSNVGVLKPHLRAPTGY